MLLIFRMQYIYTIVILYSVQTIFTQDFNAFNNNVIINTNNTINNLTNHRLNDSLSQAPTTSQTSQTPKQSLVSSTLPPIVISLTQSTPFLSCNHTNDCSPNSHCNQQSVCVCDQSFTGIVNIMII